MSTHAKMLFFGLAALGLLNLTLFGCDEWRPEKRQEEKVALAQVPAPVKATIEQEAKGGTLKEIERTSAEGKTAYAARIAVNGNEQETVIGEDGKVIRRGAVEEDDDD